MNFIKRVTKCLKADRLLGKFLFILYYFFIGLQLYVLFHIEDDKKNKTESYLYYFKLLAYSLISLYILSHIQASFTPPGLIDHSNNLQFLDFYCSTRTIAVKRADIFNKAARNLIRPPNTDEESDDEYSDAENDENIYKPSLIFNEDKVNKLNTEFGYELTICKKCNICRMPGVHHCSTCQGCIYQMDHHCPWLNNCVGQFNQKFFLQFCVYSVFSSFVCSFIMIYYVAYKRPNLLIENLRFTIIVITQMVITLCSIVLFMRLLYDQYENLEDISNLYDFKKNKMIEKRNKVEILYEIFGSLPSVWWLLPTKVGGFYNRFNSSKLN